MSEFWTPEKIDAVLSDLQAVVEKHGITLTSDEDGMTMYEAGLSRVDHEVRLHEITPGVVPYNQLETIDRTPPNQARYWINPSIEPRLIDAVFTIKPINRPEWQSRTLPLSDSDKGENR